MGCSRMIDPDAKVLVVGGTGMLAEATRWLAGRVDHLTLVARSPEALAAEVGAHSLPMHLQATCAAAHLPAGPCDLALVWLHDDMVGLARPIADLLTVGGRLVRIHGALSADPAVEARRDPDPRSDIRQQIGILGWHPDPTAEDGKRWLSDAEISGGAITLLKDESLGRLVIGTRAGP